MDQWLLSKGIYDVNGVAKVLGIHPESVRRLVRQGKIQAHKINGNGGSRCWLFDKGYIDLFSTTYDARTGNYSRES